MIGQAGRAVAVAPGQDRDVAGAGTIATAALLFVALEPFESYVKSITASGIKVLGVVVVSAWVLRLLARGRPIALSHPSVQAAGVFFAVLLASTVLHPNGVLGEQVLTRYLSYLGIFVVLVDSMRDGLAPRRVATVYVISCTAAAVVGIVAFAGGQLRAGGPVGDPNDFAFFLVSAVPLAFGLAADAARPVLFRSAAVVMSVAVVATLSRGALVAAVAMAGYALLAGVVTARTLFGWLAALAVLAAVVVIGYHARLTTSISAKGQVAQQNVDERLVRWRVAAEMTADNPLLGLGPAGFRENYDRYIDHQPADAGHHLDVAHEMYLETSAELGLPGLAAFGCIIVFGFTGARRAARAGPQQQLAGAVTVAVLGTAVAAAFLTEQYFLPVWLLAAFGAAFDPGRRAA